MRLQRNTIRRNGPCPCGSGKKTKHCCIDEIREMATAVNAGVDPNEVLAVRILGKPLRETDNA